MVLGSGWSELAEELRSDLQALDPPGVLLAVWLDSSGLPRFRVKLEMAARSEGRALVRSYESRAAEICEHCGGSGRARAGAVITVLCDDCLPER
jgi:hypothetical protein